MRSLSACQNEPHCTEAGECVLFLAIGARRVPVPPSDALVERVAKALHEANTPCIEPWGRHPHKDIWRRFARAAIAAMEVQ